MPVNRHLVDQLADVRFRRKALEEQEAELRARVLKQMGNGDELCGDEFIAYREAQRQRGVIDATKLRRAGVDPDRFRKRGVTFVKVVTEPRFTGDGQ